MVCDRPASSFALFARAPHHELHVRRCSKEVRVVFKLINHHCVRGGHGVSRRVFSDEPVPALAEFAELSEKMRLYPALASLAFESTTSRCHHSSPPFRTSFYL